MARINIEDSLFADPRFLDLVLRLGSAEMALGSLIMAYRVAQEFWKQNKRPIPAVQFRSKKLRKELIECGLADELASGDVYIKGSEEQFKWLVQRSIAGRGNKRKSGQRNRTESNGIERLGTYSSSSSSSSLSNSHSNSKSSEIHLSANADPPPSEDLLKSIWNKNRGALPEWASNTHKRKMASRKRLLEKPDSAYWETVVKCLAASNFCNGENDRGWRANPDFLLRPDTHVKVMEGQYGNKEKTGNTGIDWDRFLEEDKK